MTKKGKSISVLIAYGNALSGELLAAALNRQANFKVVSTETKTQSVLESALNLKPDIMLISASLADGPLSGFGVLRQIRESYPDLRAIILLDSPEPHLVVDAFRVGARGVFCPPESPFKLLCRCIDKVYAGQIWANSSQLLDVMEAFSQLAPLRVVNGNGMRLLTKREEAVVRLVAEGMQNRDIARELQLSEHTVKNYLFRIFDKLGVSSRVELVLYAVSSSKRMQISGDAERPQEGDSLAS